MMDYKDHKESIKYFSDEDEFHNLYQVFDRARYLTFRAREKELQRYGLTPEQAQVLFIVQAIKDKATPAEISRFLIRTPYSVSAMVDRMAKKGLVKRVKDLERKNMVRVAITKKGREAYEITTKRGPIRRILSVLDENERRQFQEYLDRIMEKAKEELGLERDDLPPSD
jgi:DNA-binding MarR family transcriptional regulator